MADESLQDRAKNTMRGVRAANLDRGGLTNLIRKSWRRLAIILLVIGVIVLAFEYIHTKNQLSDLSNPKKANQSEARKIIDKVNKYAQLPTNETPTLATVNDVSKLKTQTFFKNAQNGDKVLIYAQSGRALLYRPSTDQIIEYSEINLGTGTQ
jgi:hypothetical protein